jgi:hypothetical protein
MGKSPFLMDNDKNTINGHGFNSKLLNYSRGYHGISIISPPLTLHPLDPPIVPPLSACSLGLSSWQVFPP